MEGFKLDFNDDTLTLEFGRMDIDTAQNAAKAYQEGLNKEGMTKSLLIVRKEANLLGKNFQKLWAQASKYESSWVKASAIVVPSVTLKFLLTQITADDETDIQFFLDKERAKKWLDAWQSKEQSKEWLKTNK